MQIPQGDYGYYLNFTIQGSNNYNYDLTGYTIKLKTWVAGNKQVILIGTCSIVTAANGTCRYLVANGNFNKAGEYVAELELTKTGVVESTKPFSISVIGSH